MFQRGEVDYLVATDAIGMGLNMDVAHVAFAGLDKFDGRRERRLTIPEMAQIAGRAGRHQRDGSFGTLGLGGDNGPAFTDEEINAIEEHRFRPLDHLYWRSADLDFTDVSSLIHSLEARSDDPLLRPAPPGIDLAVLKALAEDPAVADRKGVVARRLWAACGLPDFRKVGPMHHARMVRRIFNSIADGGHVPHEWFAAEVSRLDNVAGDIEALADRLAGVRSWAYIAHRADWLAEPAKWAERTRYVESRLSDALHAALTQRFVDRRTAVLVRDIGARGADALPVTVAADGEVSVGPEPIGHLTGFDFKVDPTASLADKRLLLAAAERRLGDELDRRARDLCAGEDARFTLFAPAGGDIGIAADGHLLARLAPGRSLAEPALRTVRALDRLSAPARTELRAHMETWLERQVKRHVGDLARLSAASSDRHYGPPVRALTAMLADAGGLLSRKALAEPIGQLDRPMRAALHKLKVRLGALDVYAPVADEARGAALARRAARGARRPADARASPPRRLGPSRRRRPPRRGPRLSSLRRPLASGRPRRPPRRLRPPGPRRAQDRRGGTVRPDRPRSGHLARPVRRGARPADGRSRFPRAVGRLGVARHPPAQPLAPQPARPGNAFAALAGLKR